MPQSTGIGLGEILDSSWPAYGLLSTANPTVLSVSGRVHLATAFSTQIVTDGQSIVDYQVQVTNIPGNFSRTANGRVLGNVTTRDDTAGSQMWSTVASGTIAKGSGPMGAMILVANSAHVDARVILTYDAANTGGTTSGYFVSLRDTGT